MENDEALDHAVILDTAGDLATKVTLRCTCGNELDIRDILEEPEVGIILEIAECHDCTQAAYTRGYYEREDEHRGY